MIVLRLAINLLDKNHVRSDSTHTLAVPALPPIGSRIFINNFMDCGRKYINLQVVSYGFSDVDDKVEADGIYSKNHVTDFVLAHCNEIA